MPNSHCAVAVVAIVIGFVLPKEERRAKWRDRIVGKWSTKFPGDVIWIRCVGVFRPQLWIGIDESNWKGVLTDSDRDMHESESCRACMHVRCVSRIASCEHGGGLEGSYSWQGALIWVWYGNGKVGRLVGCLGLNLDLRAGGDWYGIVFVDTSSWDGDGDMGIVLLCLVIDSMWISMSIRDSLGWSSDCIAEKIGIGVWINSGPLCFLTLPSRCFYWKDWMLFDCVLEGALLW